MPEKTGYVSMTWAGVLITLHTLSFAATIFRIIYRQRKEKIGTDDILAVLSVGGGMFMFGTLISTVITKPHHLPLALFQVVINMYLLALWFTRASLIMGIARIFHEVDDLVTNCRFAATIMVNAGLGYCIALNLICYYNPPQPDDTGATSLSFVPLFIAIVILLTDVIADVMILYTSTKIIVKMRFLRIQEWTIRVAFTCSVWTLVSNTVCWMLLITQFHSDQSTVLCLASLSASISNIVANTPFTLRTTYKIYFREDEREEAGLKDPSTESPSQRIDVECGHADDNNTTKTNSSTSIEALVGH